MAPPRSHSPSMRTPLGRAIGLGSAKEGVEHWWRQRISAIALVPLCLWFVVVVIRLAGSDLDTFAGWLGHPVPAVAMILLLFAVFYHTDLGLRVVVEDYVHAEASKFVLVILVRLACIALGVAGIFAVLKIALA